MKRKIKLEFELEQDEYDALQAEAALHNVNSVESWLEILVAKEVIGLQTEFDPILSEEELREFQHRYGEEDWIDEIDPEIPF